MPDHAKSFIAILLLPILLAVGHDLYINYFSTPEKMQQVENLNIDLYDFKISDAGWVWQRYALASMNDARTLVDENQWKEVIDPILQLPTAVVAAAPLGIGLVYLLLAFMAGIWPFTRYSDNRKMGGKDTSVYGHAKSKNIKFSRK